MMNPRIYKAIPLRNHRLKIEFLNGEIRIFDVSPFLERGIFKQLNDKSYFDRVSVKMGTVEWPNGQDFCPDTVYENSIPYISENNLSRATNPI